MPALPAAHGSGPPKALSRPVLLVSAMTTPRISDTERREAIALVAGIYKRSEVGCCLHVILDDHNIQNAIVNLPGWDEPGCIIHDDCRRLLALLRKMKRTQRGKVIATAQAQRQKGS